jgi:hypothetical protein
MEVSLNKGRDGNQMLSRLSRGQQAHYIKEVLKKGDYGKSQIYSSAHIAFLSWKL